MLYVNGVGKVLTLSIFLDFLEPKSFFLSLCCWCFESKCRFRSDSSVNNFRSLLILSPISVFYLIILFDLDYFFILFS